MSIEKAKKFLNTCQGHENFLENPSYLPAPELRLNALRLLGENEPRIVIFGQDPYPNPESACGIAFLDAKITSFSDKRVAPSLRNLWKCMLLDYGFQFDSMDKMRAIMEKELTQRHATVRNWFETLAKAGVVWLNTSLTYESKDDLGKHTRFWKPFIEQLITENFKNNVVYVLMGNSAQNFERLINKVGGVSVKTMHPVNAGFATQQLFAQIKKEEMKLFKSYTDFVSGAVVCKE